MKNVFGPNARRVSLDSEEGKAAVEKIVNTHNCWMMDSLPRQSSKEKKGDLTGLEKVKAEWREERREAILDKVPRRQDKTIAVSRPLHGLMKCHHCHRLHDRDHNAARNIGVIFLFLLFDKDGKRPIMFQRYKTN